MEEPPKEKFETIILFDNCATHPELTELTNIRIEFVQPNFKILNQPMGHGILRRL